MTVQTQQKQAQPKQNQQEQNQVNTEKSNPFRSFFANKKKAIEALVNDNLKRKYPGFVDELIVNFAQTIQEDKTKEPYNLKNANSDSMVKAIYFCARKGLSLSQKQVHLAIYKGTLTPIIGINGYRELIRRNPRVLMFEARVRREKDLHFSLQYGANPDLQHTPNLEEDSPIIGAYAIAHLRDFPKPEIIYCTKKQIDEVRTERESKSDFTKKLWKDREEEMSTVIPLRKLGKKLGVDAEEDIFTSSTNSHENKNSYSDNVVPFVPSSNYSAQNMPDYDYNHDYEG